ncbi:hypothetical protein GGI19_006550, partial [Coemansia pectinata]
VRTLATGTHTAWPERPSVSLAEFSGIASARLRLHVPPMYGDNATHTDIRNSHIQVHHQIAYEVRYERVQAEEESSNARILAVAKVYGALANANIVRRDELKNLEVVRGTLPVAVVPKKISALWGLKNIEYDEPEYDDEPAGFPVPNTTEAHLIDLVADAPPVAAQSAYVPSSAMLDMMHNNDSYASAMPSMPGMPGVPMMPGVPSFPSMPSVPGVPTMSNFAAMPGVPSIPGMPSIPGIPGIPGMPGGSGAYSPVAPASQPMGFNPMIMPQAPLGFGMGNGGPAVDMNYNNSGPSVDTSYNMGYGNAGYNPMQQQILMFQEQQRMQQQQFFQQLSEQYGQMAVSPSSLTRNESQSHPYPRVSESQNSGYNTYGPAPPPPGHDVLLAAREPSGHITPATTVAVDISSVPTVVLPTVVVEPADTVTESVTVIELAAVTEASAPASSEPVRPDSAADIDTSSADQHLTSITAAIERSEAEASNTITTAVPVLQPLAHSAGSSTSTTASSEHNTEDTGRHSPPPNYDDLLPPDYEVPANQPPPYRPMESSRSRRRVWDI